VTFALVVLAGGLGALARSELTDRIVRRDSRAVVIATFSVNLAGSFVLGAAAGIESNLAAHAIGVGFCGAFTVYATVALDTVELSRSSRLWACGYAAAMLVAGAAAAIAGVAAAGRN
jgi:CrcB protein